jgi:hypothetical protein
MFSFTRTLLVYLQRAGSNTYCWQKASGGIVRGGIAFVTLFIAGCASFQGPVRPISSADDEQWLLPYTKGSVTPTPDGRNGILTARMYLIDLEYHNYETKLTKEMQEEGVAATLANLSLTSLASVIPVAQTDRVLSGAATAVTGADKTWSEKELLNNTIQALQAQMRTDRKAQAAKMYAKMWLNGKPTPVGTYTLAMGLADTDIYYQAGTIGSALIGLTKTVANAEQKADCAKNSAGPNGAATNAAAAKSGQLANTSPSTSPSNTTCQ